jgi:Gas vesicle synthesis protein GvpO
MRPDMAERRRTAATRPTTRSRTRRPADQDEQEVLDEDMAEPASPDEQEPIEDNGSETAGRHGSSTRRRDNGSGHDAPRHGSSFTARQAARAASRQIIELTEKQAESITGVERNEEGWTVSIEVVEDRRIPSSADILATYETRIDEDGELMSYRRVRRYSRGRGDST